MVGEEWDLGGLGEREEGTSLPIVHCSCLKSKTNKVRGWKGLA